MMQITSEQRASIAKAVQDRLRGRTKYGRFVRVLMEGIGAGDETGTWWLVPVEYQEYPPEAYQFFEMFSDIEDELMQESKLDILLVPRRMPPAPDWDAA